VKESWEAQLGSHDVQFVTSGFRGPQERAVSLFTHRSASPAVACGLLSRSTAANANSPM
jgi:hypothetical protein